MGEPKVMNAESIRRGMKLIDVYRLAVETGIKNDPRPAEDIERQLEDARKAYEKMDDDKKQYYDQERLWNPYADSRLSYGDPDTEVTRVMWGIDIGTGEVLLADRLKEKGQKIDAVVAHHPVGLAKTPFPEVMTLQNDLYFDAGVPINITEALMKPRMDEIARAVLPSNYNQVTDAARLLDIPLLNIHTPADNCVEVFLTQEFEERPVKYVGDIIDRLMTIPEFQQSAKYNSPPKIVVGGKTSRCGDVIFKMNGGTSGPKEIYQHLAAAGVGTVVGMHFPESHIEEARKHHINMVISGHMSSDSLGINIIADEWQKAGVEVVPCSGLIRVSRV